MTAMLIMNAGQTDKIASAVTECNRLDIPVLPPDINKSDVTFAIEKDGDKDGGKEGIRFGLSAIKNVGQGAVKPLVASREAGEFKSIEDFCRRADLSAINRRVLESLIKVGALDRFGPRGALLASADRILSVAQREQQLKETGQATMFDLWGEMMPTPMPAVELPETEASIRERLAWEKELLGIYLSEHPFSRVARQLSKYVTALCANIGEEIVGQGVVVAGSVISARQLSTRDGRPFVSAVLEDMSGQAEVTAWPETYQRTKELWTEGSILLVEGRVKARGDRVQLNCDRVTPYRADGGEEVKTGLPPPPRRRRLLINIAETADEEGDVARLHQIFDVLGDFPGKDEVRLRVTKGDEVISLELPDTTTGYCPEFQQRLAGLLGEENLRVEELT
jgi:DNA polymerase-3 subunit alpha